eukprot:CAMPEP_0194536402 /NCGR_PEP_ID=MMETSP0253-20130528/75321_1 /TAXON_ID=2966 /ORGANISM="Noctiluca scintillans" /LENGTH=513 /DNA_ID=CAMNT_0039382325 /DNA_START=38 /DNA_END=1579 /DNA_ORIENTATION=+
MYPNDQSLWSQALGGAPLVAMPLSLSSAVPVGSPSHMEGYAAAGFPVEAYAPYLRSDGTRGEPPVLELAVALAPDRKDRKERGRAESPKEEPRTKAARAASQLRQLLDFYFEPFNLQHNRYLLDLVARTLGPVRGPWVAGTLAEFSFSFDDLMGLGRIAAALAKLRHAHSEPWGSDVLGNLKHLQRRSDGRWQLRVPPEVRSFVHAKDAPCETVKFFMRYLAAVREQRGEAPRDMVSVLSYGLTDVLEDQTPFGQTRRGRLKRQLLLHHTDVMCLQGFHPDGNGAGLTPTLTEDGYRFVFAESNGEANSIFWDASRWELSCRLESGSALAVDLHAVGDAQAFRVICMRPDVALLYTGLDRVFGRRHLAGDPLVVCSDFTQLGGAEGAAIVEELAGLSSAMQEVLGEELQAPFAAPHVEGTDATPARAGATGFNRLCRPDALLFRGLAPVAVLSGHTEHYMAMLHEKEVMQQFPAFHIPLVAAFEWQASVDSDMVLVEPTQGVGVAGDPWSNLQ